MKEFAKNVFSAAVEVIFPETGYDELVIVEETDEQFGEYASNIAMILAGREKANPRAIAERVAAQINETQTDCTASVAGPGFINLAFSDSYFIAQMQQPVGVQQLYDGKTVLVEFSDPNPFKQLHVGHLYTSIVGDAIARFYERLGARVLRLNFGGDVGLHVAKSMYGMRVWCGGELDEQKIATVKKEDRAQWLGEVYVTGNTAYENDADAKEQITSLNTAIYAIHRENDHASDFAKVYWLTRQWSYDYFEDFYASLGLAFDKYYPESVTAFVGEKVVKEQIASGVYEQSDGAVIFRGDKYGLHTRVFINKQGLPTYETKDVGLSIMKEDDYSPDTSIIITADEQKEYMRVVIKSIEQFRPELAHKTQHITHGLVKRPGGVKMSSRLGNGLMAVDVIDDVRTLLQTRDKNIDEKIVLGAIKYTFLTQKIGGDILFDPEASISLQGNSGPYIQYALVRAKSILARSLSNIDNTQPVTEQTILPEEKSILRKIAFFEDIVFSAAEKQQPHLLCSYMFELAKEFNRFYEKAPVLDNERTNLRIAVVNKYTCILQESFNLLGIEQVERM